MNRVEKFREISCNTVATRLAGDAVRASSETGARSCDTAASEERFPLRLDLLASVRRQRRRRNRVAREPILSFISQRPAPASQLHRRTMAPPELDIDSIHPWTGLDWVRWL